MRLIDADAFLERMSHTDRFLGSGWMCDPAKTRTTIATFSTSMPRSHLIW